MDETKELKKRKGKRWDYMYTPINAIIYISPEESKKKKVKESRKWYMASPPGSLIIKRKNQRK